MVNEGLAMLGEGVHPMSIERAATQAGYPVGTLQLSDELNMELMAKIAKATADAAAATAYRAEHPGTAVVDAMLEAGRPVAAAGAGFYDYDGRSARPALWSGLAELFPPRPSSRLRRRQGPLALHRGARDREVLRGGRDRVGGRGQHRLDHGHRLPARTPAAPRSS